MCAQKDQTGIAGLSESAMLWLDELIAEDLSSAQRSLIRDMYSYHSASTGLDIRENRDAWMVRAHGASKDIQSARLAAAMLTVSPFTPNITPSGGFLRQSWGDSSGAPCTSPENLARIATRYLTGTAYPG